MKIQVLFSSLGNTPFCHVILHEDLFLHRSLSWLVSFFTEGLILTADVPFKFSALTRSCVVIPCSFQQQDMHLTRGIWSKKDGGVVYHNGQSYILDHFKDRTKILGDLHEGECSLEIDDVKPFDNGPFCFYAEKDNEKYRFNNSCAFLIFTCLPFNVSCSVNHTCPSYPPVFSWSVTNLTSEVTDTMTTRGVWSRTSTITFMVSGGDGVKSLTCTAIFLRDKQQASTVKINLYFCNLNFHRRSLWDRLSR
uniref:Uncharacterized LOC113133269 n=1 Tax=Mastacembelus armatus TaxID=205130 RepID=A0A7N8X1K1_9TELE